MTPEQALIPSTDARSTLIALGAHVAEDICWTTGVELVNSNDMPPAYLRLLVHRNHMTPTLKAFHGEAVALQVVAHHEDARWYRRRILLTAGSQRHVVEFGLVRIDLTSLPGSVKQEVLERRRPLGDILIAHGVLTSVEPRAYFRFATNHPVTGALAPSSCGSSFGRIGVIRCNGHYAMELLEVVTDARRDGANEA